MTCIRPSILSVAVISLSFCATMFTTRSFSQSAPEEEVVITKLSPPAYPPLAKLTRISGSVEILVEMRKNGVVASTRVLQGHPLFVQAALDSARKSQYACRNCDEKGFDYRVIYSFELAPPKHCDSEEGTDQAYPRVNQTGNQVTVIEQPTAICDPVIQTTYTKERSLRCLYLWRCKRPRVIGVE